MRLPAMVIAGFDSSPAARNMVTSIAAMSLHTPLRCSKIMSDGCSVNPSPSPMVCPL